MSAEDRWITIPCITVRQPIGKFYIASIPCQDLVEMSFADRRHIIEGQREIEVVSGIQRQISPKRVDEIRQYVTTVDACFPTGIILAIESKDARFDSKANTLTIRCGSDVASIIQSDSVRSLQILPGVFRTGPARWHPSISASIVIAR